MPGSLGWLWRLELQHPAIWQGEPLELTADVRTLLRRSAREVAIPAENVQQALRSLRTAKPLLRKIRKRIEDGAWRWMLAEHRARRLQDVGDLERARKLARIVRLQKVAKSGRVDPKLSERAISRMLDLREAGDLEGARQQMRDLLAVETVPMYRRAAEENLAGLDEPLPAPVQPT
ncbi:DUSAM domain-containing protein [Stigmatella sp. ncwal1]|uniref:DUSAM domain-containing protein n=1 Tax=Stigmatella ashevillensis TaxID=2995309 RepID=A0ABT5DHV3_9BACT|nr:DUSAM domain-containing protein [Stigmatella ashevillena]MDC0712715.1 DUSAM domain-containing protein [Stigmatella ashevillena]